MVGNTNTGDTDFRRIGMATSYSNATVVMTVCTTEGGYTTLKREPSFWADFALDILRGAVVNWVYSKRFDEWRLTILYWKKERPCIVKAQRVPYRQAHYSGFRSRERGRHRNFKSRLQRY